MSDHQTSAERISDVELQIVRTFEAPVHKVFEAWTKAELFQRWWAPQSMGVPILSCEMDVRTGGGYRIAFGQNAESAMVFYGKYLEVVPNARLIWTNEEQADGAITTVTFAEDGTRTRLLLQERYPSKGALDGALSGMEGGMAEQFAQLDALLAALG